MESSFADNIALTQANNEELAQQFISECRVSVDRTRNPCQEFAAEQPRPSTSTGQGQGRSHGEMGHSMQRNYLQSKRMTGDERGEQLIREVELSRSRIFQIPGNSQQFNQGQSQGAVGEVNNVSLDGGAGSNSSRFWHTSMVDESYLAAAAHVDDGTREKIVAGQYINFARLLPKDRIQMLDEENRLECVVRGGETYFVPALDRNSPTIGSFNRWDQAFMIFANIYLDAHPNRYSELLEYQYSIKVASTGFPWENVYSYDRDFRLHMSKYPSPSLAMILQQAWSMRLMKVWLRTTGGRGRMSRCPGQ